MTDRQIGQVSGSPRLEERGLDLLPNNRAASLTWNIGTTEAEGGGRGIQPGTKMASKKPTALVKGHRRTSSMADDTSKNLTRLPTIPTKSSYDPRKTKVSFLPSSQQVVQQRRLSVPEESLNGLPKSILKKRNSLSVEYEAPAPQNDQIDMSILWTLQWERELYLPPVSRNGALVSLDEDGSLPPMLRRLSNADTYNYSQEFLKALDDLKNRPSSSQQSGNDTSCG